MTRLLLSGYYGYGNAGDEAVLAGLTAGFRAARPAGEMEITALSGRPAETETLHGIRAADRYRPSALAREIRRTDLFLSGGGSLLQDVTSAHGIFYYLGVTRLAQMLGKKTMFIAQGLGPLVRPRSRRLVRAVADRLDAVTVRDPASAALLRELGVTRPPIEVTADPALLLASGPSPVSSEAAFGVALRPWAGQDGLAALVAEACLPALHGCLARLLPMQPEHDAAAAEQFARRWTQAGGAAENCADGALPALLPAIAACEIIVGMRLHALILAAASGVPSVALSYDPKVAAFMAASGQGDAIYDLARPDPDALAALIARVWAERAARADALRSALPGLRAAAARNIDVALTV